MSRFTLRRWQLIAVVFALSVAGLFAAPPPWWTARGVVDTGATTKDYAAVNLGQVKRIAVLARDEMEAKLPGGAGSAINSLVASWAQPAAVGVVRNDYAVVNLGQLKALSKLYYDRLGQVGYTGQPLSAGQSYPWTATTSDDKDYAVANIGQVKYLFSFNLAPPPTGVTLSNTSSNSVTLSWTAPSGGATLYEIFQNGVSIGTTAATSIQITGLSPLTTYAFTVRAKDSSNNWSAQSAVFYTRTWQRLHEWSVDLTYTEGQDEEGYGNGQWEYSTAEFTFWANGPFKVYANSTSLSLTLVKDAGWQTLGTSNGAPISYTSPSNQVYRALLTNGDGNYTLMVDVQPQNQPPVANFNVSQLSGRAPLAVSFSDNGSADPDGVIASYSWDFDNNGTTDASGTTAAYTYANTGTTPVTYVAKFTVLDSGGTSASATKSVIVYPESSHSVAVQGGTSNAPYQVTGSTVTLTATAPLNGQQFSHWSIVSGTGTFANANTSSTSFTMGSGSVEVKANYILDVTPPAAPLNLVASDHTAISMKLSWSAATDNVGVAGYEVYRDGTLVGETATTSVTVRGLTPSTDYQFTVRAKDAASNLSVSSAIAHARTWQHRVTWSGTLTHTEELDEEGNGTGQWSYSTESRTIQAYEASGPFKVYVVINGGAELTLARYWTWELIGQTSNGSYISGTGNGSQAYTAWLSKGDGDFQFYVDVPSSNQLPIANFTISPTAGLGPTSTITVNASGSSDPDGPTSGLTYAWDFDGNGTADATGITATWTYTNTSNAWIFNLPRLRVTDIATGQSEISKTFIMYPPGSRAVVVQGGAPSEPYLWPYDTVTLTAGAPTTGQAFLGWTLVSGTGTIADPTAKVTTFTATGSSNIVVKANYGADVIPPSVPPAFQVGSVTGSTATLTWTPATDNVGVVLYEIYNGTTFLAATASTTVTLNNLTPSTTYLFNVRAIDAAGLKSAPTASVVAGTWKRLLDASGTIDSDEGVGTSVSFTFQVTEAGMLRLYTTGSTATRANLAGPTNLGWVEGAGGNVAFTRQVSSGAYTLTVAGHNGDVSGDFQVFVEHGVHLQPDFRATPDSGTSGITVSFDASASLDPNGSTITSYQWDFTNDGTTDASGITTSHFYGAGNVYTAKLTITNSVGLTASITRKIVTQTVQAFTSSTPVGNTTLVVTPSSGLVGTQVALSAPAHDSQGNPFLVWQSWAGGTIEEVHSRTAVLTLSPFGNNVTAYYGPGVASHYASYLTDYPALAEVGQAFSMKADSSTPTINGTHIAEHTIAYSTDFGQTWIDGTISAGTKWRKGPTDTPEGAHQLISSFSFANPGWVFFRAQAVTNTSGGTFYGYGRTLIVTKNESDVVAVVNGTATPSRGPAGTVIQLSASPSLGAAAWWEILSGSGTIDTYQMPWTTFTKGAGPVVLRANPGSPYMLTVANGQSNKTYGAIGSSFQITANAPPAGQLFDHWELTSGEGTFSSEFSASTTFVIGQGGAMIRSVYRSVDAPTTLIARSRSSVPRGDTFEITATAKDPNGNLTWLEIEYSTDEGKTWVAASSAAVTPPPSGQPLPQGPQGPTRWTGTGASKTISVTYFFDPFKWTTYWFRTRSGDASGYVSSYALATVSVLNNKPKASILAQSGGVVEHGSADAAAIPELEVTTGSLFDIIADGAAPTTTLEEVRVDYLNGGIFKEGNEVNGRLWKPAISVSTAEGRVKKTFDATQLGVGIHQFQARSLFKKVYSDYGYIRVKVIPPTPASVAKPIVSKIIQDGQNGDLSFEPKGSRPMAIQWYKGNVAVADGAEIAGANSEKIEFRPARYASRGAYKALVSNEHGGGSSNAADLIVNRPPVAAFAASSTSGPAPLTVTFNASGSSDPDSGETPVPDYISAYVWDFGNGRTKTTTTPTVDYKYYAIGKPATFNVKLTVWDSRGGKADAGPLTITVDKLPGGGADTDGDGIPDAWEDVLGFDKNSAADGLADNDKDGWTNVAEYNNQTDPLDANSYPGMQSKEAALGNEWLSTDGQVVGSTPGSASVNLSGAATYSIPIKVTPGSVGMQPELSLEYSSQGGNGHLGLGWQLSGLPTITRGPATYIVDGEAKGVTFTSTDRFYLNGARLIAVGTGDYGSSGMEYRTEIDSYSRIKSYGSEGNGPSYFKVWTKAGQILTFGNTRDSQLRPATGTPLTWAVNEVADLSGNSMRITYRSAAPPTTVPATPETEIMPYQISYTHNAAATSGYATVTFHYDTRIDTQMGYAFDAPVATTMLLKSITIKQGTSVYRQYRLDYGEGGSRTRPSLLKSVQEATSESLASSDKYPATTFDYFGPASGKFTKASHQTDKLYTKNSIATDVNGDGLTDLVFFEDDGSIKVSIYKNNGESFEWTDTKVFFGILPDNAWLRLTDMDGDGLSEIIAIPNTPGQEQGKIRRMKVNAAGKLSNFEDIFIQNYRHLTGGGNCYIADFNGDGLEDLLLIQVGATSDSANGQAQFFESVGSTYSAKAVSPAAQLNNGLIEVGDFTGDGIADVLNVGDNASDRIARVYSVTQAGAVALIDSTNLGQKHSDWQIFSADVNGDGQTDLIYSYKATNPSTGDTNANCVEVWTRVGHGGDPRFVKTATQWIGGWNPDFQTRLFDYDGDGKADIAKFWKLVVSGSAQMHLEIWQASGPAESPFELSHPFESTDSANPTHSSIHHVGKWYETAGSAPTSLNNIFPAQLDRDGLGDLLVVGFDYNSDNKKAVGVNFIRLVAKGSTTEDAGAYPNLLQTVTDGLGVKTSFSYLSLLVDDIYTKNTGAVWPDVDVRPPFKVVSMVDRQRSEGRSILEQYIYGGLRSNARRGMRGFGWIRHIDSLAKMEKRTEYYQNFPYTNLPKNVKVYYGKVLTAESTMGVSTIDEGKISRPYISSTYTNEYDLAGAIARTRYSTSVQDKYGNGTSHYERIAPGLVAQTAMAESTALSEGHFERKVVTPSFDENTDGENWLIARPKKIQTYARSGDDPVTASSVTRTVETVYHPGDTRIDYVLQEPTPAEETTPHPVESAYRIKTQFGYDDYGNVTSTTVSSPNADDATIVSRTSRVDYSALSGFHHVAGRFPQSATDALDQKTSFVYNWLSGLIIKRKDEANKLEVAWEYDSFGKPILETRPDGTTTTKYRWDNAAVAMINEKDEAVAVGTAYHIDVRTSGSAPVLTRFDSLGLPIQQVTVAGDGITRYVETRYNERGNVIASSRPHTGSGTAYWTKTTYDHMNRVTERLIPSPEGNGKDTFTYAYSELSVTETDARALQTKRTSNALGSVATVERNPSFPETATDRSIVRYKYDGFGNLREVEDAAGNKVEIKYDRLGRKTELTDPNMGTWRYTYYANGLLRTQKDAKSAITTLTYDKLDRKHTETIGSRVSTWVYKVNASETKLPGARQLESAKVEESGDVMFQQTWTYDSDSRVSGGTRSFRVGPDNYANYSFAQSYGDFWRPKTTTYSTSGPAFATIVKYGAFGHVREVRRSDSTYTDNFGQIYWRGADYEEDGQLRLAYLGNGVALDRVHYDEDGRPKCDEISVSPAEGGVSMPTLLLQYYGFDGIGNLRSRGVIHPATGEGKVRYIEVFGYDGMNRVTTVGPAAPSTDSSVPAPTVVVPSRTYSYDKIGNILEKDGSAFSYTRTDSSEPLAPHAVRSAMGVTYGYDANGNLSKINNTERVTWTAFNQPATIANATGTESSSFTYGPGGERVTQTAQSGPRTRYVGPSHEVTILPDDAVEQRIYVSTPLGRTVVVQFNGGSATPSSTRYLTQDQLTSVAFVTTESGKRFEQFSYDPWGAPREPETLASSGSWPARQATTRGFTDHEMLSRLQLIHMNGRVYNPSLGRFLSPDPFVNEEDGTQLLNRYAYVRNNPLSLIDPTGFASVEKQGTPPVKEGQPKDTTGEWTVAKFFSYWFLGSYNNNSDQATLNTKTPNSGVKDVTELQEAPSGYLLSIQLRSDEKRKQDSELLLAGVANGVSMAADVAPIPVPSKWNVFSRLGDWFSDLWKTGKHADVPPARFRDAVTNGVEFIDDVAARSRNVTVALDANALIRGLEKGELAALNAAIAGQTPTISITAAKEFLRKGDVNVLREFLASRGGYVGQAATAQQISQLQAQAQVLGRVLRSKDAAVAGSAINEGATIVTRDEKFAKFLNAAGIPARGF